MDPNCKIEKLRHRVDIERSENGRDNRNDSLRCGTILQDKREQRAG